jgi:hypothetical protein
MNTDVLKFAFAVYQYKEAHQANARLPINVLSKMHEKTFIADLVTGVLGTCVEEGGDHPLIPASSLARLDELLRLWAETCGLDFGADVEAGQHFPLSVCWGKKQHDALPIVHVLFKRGYKPGKGLGGSPSAQFFRARDFLSMIKSSFRPEVPRIPSGGLTLIVVTQKWVLSCKVKRRPLADIFLNGSLPPKSPC